MNPKMPKKVAFTAQPSTSQSYGRSSDRKVQPAAVTFQPEENSDRNNAPAPVLAWALSPHTLTAPTWPPGRSSLTSAWTHEVAAADSRLSRAASDNRPQAAAISRPATAAWTASAAARASGSAAGVQPADSNEAASANPTTIRRTPPLYRQSAGRQRRRGGHQPDSVTTPQSATPNAARTAPPRLDVSACQTEQCRRPTLERDPAGYPPQAERLAGVRRVVPRA